MNQTGNSVAFGAPGIEPRWTSSAKEGIGTAYHTSCRLWFTLSHGIINEIYYPRVDQPNTRDLQFLISDGETFCHEEKRDLEHLVEYPERDCLLYRLTNTEPNGRYRLIKHVLTDPHRSVLIVHTSLEVMDETLRGRLRIYSLLAPHGADNFGRCCEIGASELMHAQRDHIHLVTGCSSGFARRSVGFVGASDGWQDLRNFKMDWEFRKAERGNIALTGEIDLPPNGEFTIAVACGGSYPSTAAKVLQSLAEPFESHRERYARQWQRAVVNPKFDFSKHTSDGGGMYRLSRCVLLAHEDKVFQGAIVASLSIPWGETKAGNADLGGYHLVWTRDLVQSATALLATGQTGTPQRALIWLAALQSTDGSFPQNSWIDGSAYWSGLQLDEIAAPILLAWRIHRQTATLGLFDPSVLILRAAARLILQGPVTGQDRWEENSGYSPSTLAVVIAGLVCAAECAKTRGEPKLSNFIFDYADWIVAHLEEWTVTTQGELVDGYKRHYIRINPTDPNYPDPHADPNSTMIQVANGGGYHPARNVVGGDFLHLVRFGIRSANDPIVRESIKVIDRVLKHDLPQGPAWRRYNHDGYGESENGGAFDGVGVGRCWPILTGERGHYELAAGGDPMPFIKAIEDFANQGGMIPEQLWDVDDLLEPRLRRGLPTGAAMPLCWSHAEYISLVRSRRDGVCFDRIEPAFQRYVVNPVESRFEIWSLRHALRHMPRGKTLRIIVATEAIVLWSMDNWALVHESETTCENALNIWFTDIPTANLPRGAIFDFTIFWKREAKWQGRNWQVTVL
ncbi:MAG TPA: glycoside hydrolase family 15 protein [Candidatus Kapabacteria bacterium]|nr:glycoside hydrolase family 15 protein [Candidatus Kapabacteria bacterium]